MKYLTFKNMKLYVLHRSKELDHTTGRPAIFLNYFGKESLVWTGTTQHNSLNEVPISLNLNGKETLFYSNGIQKVKTSALKGKWKSLSNGKTFNIPKNLQKQLISKFCEFTNLTDPYQQISNLSNEIQKLNTKVDELQKANQELKQDIKELITINKQLTNKVNCLTSELRESNENNQEFSR